MIDGDEVAHMLLDGSSDEHLALLEELVDRLRLEHKMSNGTLLLFLGGMAGTNVAAVPLDARAALRAGVISIIDAAIQASDQEVIPNVN